MRHDDHVTRRSSILDGNSFRAENAAGLDERTLALAGRREMLGPAYRLFYRTPVHLVRGEKAHLFDADGLEYLDAYNNVASVGHAHPRVVAAVAEQAAALNTHTRYLHEAILRYSEELLATLPGMDRVMYLCTGSEANDLAIRVARYATGHRGVIVTSEAYHGNTDLVSGMSPALGGGQAVHPEVRVVPAPDPALAAADGFPATPEGTSEWFAGHVRAAVASLDEAGDGVAALLVDAVFSSDGIFPASVLGPAVAAVRAAGGLFVADEVQPGFARTGEEFWGHLRHGLEADVVTTGKPMGNGIPVSAMATRAEVLEPFATTVPYFNTFGGNPVSIAAAQAVLDVIRDEGLQAHALTLGTSFRAELSRVAAGHDAIGEVRGVGLYTGVEIVGESGEPDAARALDVVEGLRDRRVLTSVCGPHNNVLKVRPPLPFTAADITWFCEALDETLARP